MRKIFFYFLILVFCSCGQYGETQIDLTTDEETAIENHLKARCIVDNAALFNSLTTSTADFDSSDIAELTKYTVKESGKSDVTMVVLNKSSTVMYIYVQSNDGTSSDKFYKYTTTNNSNHMTAVKNLACGSINTFSGDTNSLSVTANFYDPDKTSDNRIEYSSKYSVDGSRPIFFSLFSRSYNKKEYVDGASTSTVNIDVSYTVTSTTVSLDQYDDSVFDNADHCVFDSDWVDANYPGTISNTLSCAASNFTFADIEAGTP